MSNYANKIAVFSLFPLQFLELKERKIIRVGQAIIFAAVPVK